MLFTTDGIAGALVGGFNAIGDYHLTLTRGLKVFEQGMF